VLCRQFLERTLDFVRQYARPEFPLAVGCFLCGSAAGNGRNDENEKENGTEGIKRKPSKNEALEMMLNVLEATSTERVSRSSLIRKRKK
jgi:hypothetical protein